VEEMEEMRGGGDVGGCGGGVWVEEMVDFEGDEGGRWRWRRLLGCW